VSEKVQQSSFIFSAKLGKTEEMQEFRMQEIRMQEFIFQCGNAGCRKSECRNKNNNFTTVGFSECRVIYDLAFLRVSAPLR